MHTKVSPNKLPFADMQQMESNMCSKYHAIKYDVNKRQLFRSELHLSKKTKYPDVTDINPISTSVHDGVS